MGRTRTSLLTLSSAVHRTHHIHCCGITTLGAQIRTSVASNTCCASGAASPQPFEAGDSPGEPLLRADSLACGGSGAENNKLGAGLLGELKHNNGAMYLFLNKKADSSGR